MQFLYFDFKNWVERKFAENALAPIGYCGDPFNCPVATWVKERVEADKVAVVGYAIDVDDQEYECPEWVRHVMDIADGMGEDYTPIPVYQFRLELKEKM